jgi:hypothetical protein
MDERCVSSASCIVCSVHHSHDNALLLQTLLAGPALCSSPRLAGRERKAGVAGVAAGRARASDAAPVFGTVEVSRSGPQRHLAISGYASPAPGFCTLLAAASLHVMHVLWPLGPYLSDLQTARSWRAMTGRLPVRRACASALVSAAQNAGPLMD